MASSESIDETSRSSVSSLKSRFEQLATQQVRNGPEPQQPHQRQPTLSPIQQAERSRSIEEQKPPRLSIDGPPPAPINPPLLFIPFS